MNKLSTLTEKQREILRFIYTEIKNSQLPPSLREIASHFGLASVSSVQDHLAALVQKGFIRISEGKSRAIEIIKENIFSIPIIGTVQAGMPTLAVENIDEYLDLDDMIFSGVDIFGLRVKGDSMVDAGIMPHDLVVVRQQSVAEAGEIVVAVAGEEATVKYLKKIGGKYYLVPANPKYNPIPLTNEFSIIGIVLTVIRKLGK